ncbi:MAG: hypothetical protein ACRYG7_18195 [Janthinobacterium lividum]
MRKNTLIADPARSIHYLGPTTCGSTHDYQVLKNEFGLPYRKPHRSKKRPTTVLADEQRIDNTVHARRRVKVEHAISGAKRLGCVAQTCRNKSTSFTDRLLALACGIWNWHLEK